MLVLEVCPNWKWLAVKTVQLFGIEINRYEIHSLDVFQLISVGSRYFESFAANSLNVTFSLTIKLPVIDNMAMWLMTDV